MKILLTGATGFSGATSRNTFADWGKYFAEKNGISFINFLLDQMYGPDAVPPAPTLKKPIAIFPYRRYSDWRSNLSIRQWLSIHSR